MNCNLRMLLSCIVVVMAFAAMGQTRSEGIRPRWISSPPVPTNNTFVYEMHSATARTLDGARDMCLDGLITHAGLKSGVVVTSDKKSDAILQQHWDNGRLTETYRTDSHTSTSAKSDEQKLYVENVAEYWERDHKGDYHLTTLFAKSALGEAPLFDNVTVTDRYGARGLVRSIVIPGWGQLYKGSTLKGCLILGGTAAIAAGIIFTENQRADYVRKIKATHNQNLIKSYRTKRDHFATARNICIGAAAALYVYNLVDAIVAPGASRIVVRNYGRGKGNYSVVPSISPDGMPCVAAHVTF